MYIGELARRTGATPKAIRHYESLGLLGEVGRRGSYRIYGEAALRQVALIRRAQALGLRLIDLLPAFGSPGEEPDWQCMLGQIEQRRAAIRAEAERLAALDRQLDEIVAEIGQCLAGGQRDDACQPGSGKA